MIQNGFFQFVDCFTIIINFFLRSYNFMQRFLNVRFFLLLINKKMNTISDKKSYLHPPILVLPRCMLSYIHLSQSSASFESYSRLKSARAALWRATFRMFSSEISNPCKMTLVMRNFSSQGQGTLKREASYFAVLHFSCITRSRNRLTTATATLQLPSSFLKQQNRGVKFD